MSLLDRLKQLFADAKANSGADGNGAAAPAPAATSAAATPIIERRRNTRAGTRGDVRILVIDDSPTIVALLKRMLVQNEDGTLEA